MGDQGQQDSPGFDSAAGQLLVSVPNMGDDNFDRTVVFMIEHNHGGALGVVLNRPSESDVEDRFGEFDGLVASPPVFFIGGPVSVGGVMVLGRRSLGADLDNAVAIAGPIVIVDPESLIALEVSGVESLRFFSGYSGWGPGQLDGEIAFGAWHVCESMVDDVFCSDPDRLWRSVMKRQGGKLTSESFYPDDLSAN